MMYFVNRINKFSRSLWFFSPEKRLAWAFEYYVSHNIVFGPPIQSVSGLVHGLFQVIFLPCESYGAAFCEPKGLEQCDV